MCWVLAWTMCAVLWKGGRENVEGEKSNTALLYKLESRTRRGRNPTNSLFYRDAHLAQRVQYEVWSLWRTHSPKEDSFQRKPFWKLYKDSLFFFRFGSKSFLLTIHGYLAPSAKHYFSHFFKNVSNSRRPAHRGLVLVYRSYSTIAVFLFITSGWTLSTLMWPQCYE